MTTIQNGMSMTLQASGDIYPRRFVKMSTAADYTAEVCGAGEMPVGISQEYALVTPLTSTEGVAAGTGNSIGVYGVTKVALLDVATTVTAGAFLKSNASGEGIPAVAGDKYGCVAMQSGVDGNQIQVLVQVGELET